MNPRAGYHYTECGLENVWIHGTDPVVDDKGQITYVIHNQPGLHKEIARSIACQKSGMIGAELRFLRTEIGYTQDQLAQIVHRDAQTIGRWERDEIEIDQAAETIVRLLAIQELNLGRRKVVKISKLSVRDASGAWAIDIDGSDPENYTLDTGNKDAA